MSPIIRDIAVNATVKQGRYFYVTKHLRSLRGTLSFCVRAMAAITGINPSRMPRKATLRLSKEKINRTSVPVSWGLYKPHHCQYPDGMTMRTKRKSGATRYTHIPFWIQRYLVKRIKRKGFSRYESWHVPPKDIALTVNTLNRDYTWLTLTAI